jgi:uncharacterized protein DUF6262
MARAWAGVRRCVRASIRAIWLSVVIWRSPSASSSRSAARRQVDQAIQDLLKSQEAVNSYRVAAAAGVSKSYLYAQRELRERIEALRRQGGRRVKEQASGKDATPITERRKDVLLAAKQRRIEALEAENRQAENRRLKEELRVALGNLYAQT